jgi:hypothetical protein
LSARLLGFLGLRQVSQVGLAGATGQIRFQQGSTVRLRPVAASYCKAGIYFIVDDLPSTATNVVDDAMHHGSP